MNTMRNAVNWFEIPTTDLDRAARFYERVLGIELRRENFMGTPHAMFPADRPGVGGALIAAPDRKAAAEGTLIYLDATGKLDAALARVADLGGQVVLPRTSIGAPGFIALVRDTEGNVVGLHAPT
jgi:predicted enzyme related to lactoylglutathione lyase